VVDTVGFVDRWSSARLGHTGEECWSWMGMEADAGFGFVGQEDARQEEEDGDYAWGKSLTVHREGGNGGESQLVRFMFCMCLVVLLHAMK
jgi:hypothetical protein